MTTGQPIEAYSNLPYNDGYFNGPEWAAKLEEYSWRAEKFEGFKILTKIVELLKDMSESTSIAI